jgi:TolB-like protein/DNA-binding winged helix-turn-helix (wHTH) protein/Tfp pilus assembly protein PilF
VPDSLETKRFYDFGPYRLDWQVRILLRDEAIVPLTPKVLQTLAVLVQRPSEVVTKAELLKEVWPDTFVEEGNLAQNVSVLRRALGEDHLYIETVPKRGYRFVAEVRTSGGKALPAATGAAEALTAPAMPAGGGVRRPTIRLVRGRIGVAIGFLLILSGALTAWHYRQSRQGVTGIRSLAILPLENLSGDPGQDYFADGITELLTAEISRALPLRVTSRTSAMRFRHSGKPLPVLARELKVDAVLEGSVARFGSRVRITAQLIEASADRHIWAETYDREITDVPVLQREIGRAVAHAIRARIGLAGSRLPARVDPAAFEDSLRARHYLDERSPESIPQAISWYKKAIAEDPVYAPAYAGLADSYNQLGTVMVGGQSPSGSRKLAIAAASRALEIDPELAEAHAALGYSNLYEWNWDHARASLERAVALNPNYAPGHLWLAHYLCARRRFDEAQQQVRLARDLDPLSPIIQTQVGWLLSHAGLFPEAIVEFQKALQMEPGYQWAQWQLGSALMHTGDYTGAIQVLQTALAPNRNPSTLGTLGYAYGLAGDRRQAEGVLRELRELSRRRYVPPQCFVFVYWGLRDREGVFEGLEKSYLERSNSLVWLGVARDVKWLESDPRFDDLLHRIGLK